MQRALFVGILLGLTIPLVGVTVVLRRLSMIGDALSHTSLAGVAAGLIAGINPVAGALCTCLAGALCIEGVRRHFRDQSEIAVAVVLAFGIGLAGVLSGFVPNAGSFTSFMFGSILTVTSEEVWLVIIICLVALLVCIGCARTLFLLSFDERHARTCGIRTGLINIIFTILVAAVIAVAARTVGSLIVSSVMVVPVACALQIARSWKQTCIISSAVGLFSTVCGLIISYYIGLKPGGTIVLVAVALLVLIFTAKLIGRRLIRPRQ